jgi:RND superfamily putative drug exporter
MHHRRRIVIGWVLIAVAATVLAQAAGRNWATNFTLPGTESQRALDLLTREFPTQSGDLDTIVFHTSSGTIDSPSVRSAITPLLEHVSAMPHVVTVVSPYSPRGALQISPDRRTAFASIYYSKRANLLPNSTGQPVLNAINAVHVAGLKLAAGGQVIEDAEGFSIGPATAVGALAALVILLITFGSLLAAGLPLITAGFGLVTGVGLIGLATHVTSMSNVAPELAAMIGLGVGIDYALFIVTRFRENYTRLGDIEQSVMGAMDTSGRAILLAGTTVVIALLGMFATGVSFMYGLAIASVLAVLLVMAASLTLLPALLSRYGHRLARRRRLGRAARAGAASGGGQATAAAGSVWRRWSLMVQSRPWVLAAGSLVVMVVFLSPVFALRLENSDAGNDPSGTSTRAAFNLLAHGFGPGFNGPLAIVASINSPEQRAALPTLRARVAASPDVVTVGAPRISPSGKVAVIQAYPGSAPQAQATTDLVNHLRHDVIPPLEQATGLRVLVGGFTAGSIDFASVLAGKLPLFIGIVVVLSALLLFVIFRSLVIPVQAAVMNLLSIGGALGATVLVFQKGVLAGVLGVDTGPVEPWIPVIMFAVVFGLSMDYQVFLVSRVREEWMRTGNARTAVADGIASTGPVITAAAAIMICVFLSFLVGDQRSLKEFGFGLGVAVFLDAVVIRCVLTPAVLEILGPTTWRLPRWLDERLPRINIEGGAAREAAAAEQAEGAGGEPGADREHVPVG